MLFTAFVWGEQVKGQCLSVEDFDFEIIEGKDIVVNFSKYRGSLSGVEFALYNYSSASFYKSISLSSNSINGALINRDLKTVRFDDIPKGDYLLVIKKSICDDIYLGKDFSGFPYSGLRID
jgi:hypothetical protein